MKSCPKKFIVLLMSAILFAPVFLMAQRNQEKEADRLYNEFAYRKAAEKYEALHRSDPANARYAQQLAYCYYKIPDYDKAVKYYALLVQSDACKPADIYDYAQLLRIVGRNGESKTWLEKYMVQTPGDSRAAKQLENISLLMKMTANSENVDIFNLPENSKYTDISPMFYKDKIVYASAKDSFSMVRNSFEWNDQPFLDLYEIDGGSNPEMRTDKKMPGEVNTRFHEGPACFSSDFNTIYFTRNNFLKGKVGRTNSGVNNLKIYTANYTEKGWKNVQGFKYNSDEYSVGHPALSPDNKTLYFISDMPGGYGETDLYKSEWENGSWGKPLNLGADLNTRGKEMFPFVDKNGILYFASNGLPGLGGLDIFAAKEEEGRYTVVNLGEPLNSSHDDFGYIINPDSLSGYFSSNRPGGKGDDDSYFFAVKSVEVNLTTIDDQTRRIIPGVTVTLKTSNGNALGSAVSDQDGKAKFRIDPATSYLLDAEKMPYTASEQPLTFQKISPDFVVDENLYLKQSASYLTLEVLDKETGLTIPNALVDVSKGKYSESELDDNNGVIHMKVYEGTEYTFLVTADGYFEQNVKFSTIGKALGNYSLAVELEKIASGKQFVLEDLHYGVNKWDISPESAIVLDQLARILTDNPQVRIEIGSHTDSRGSAAYNLKLSQNRSEAVKNYLVGKGISPDRLVAKGYGESQLISKCPEGIDCPEDEQAANRRTVIEILNSDIQKIKRGTKNIYYF